MRSLLSQVLDTGAYPNYTHIKITVKKTACGRKKKKKNEKKRKENTTAQIGTNARARVFNAGLLARNQFASGSS
jgi:hypothetical protein